MQNLEDIQRLTVLCDQLRKLALELPQGGIISLRVRVDRAGHICQRDSRITVETFPLDATRRSGGP